MPDTQEHYFVANLRLKLIIFMIMIYSNFRGRRYADSFFLNYHIIE